MPPRLQSASCQHHPPRRRWSPVWDTYSGTGAVDPVDAAVVAAGVTASFVTTTIGVDWNIYDERGASNDGTWGTNTAGTDFSVTVEAQGSGGTPLVVASAKTRRFSLQLPARAS